MVAPANNPRIPEARGLSWGSPLHGEASMDPEYKHIQEVVRWLSG